MRSGFEPQQRWERDESVTIEATGKVVKGH